LGHNGVACGTDGARRFSKNRRHLSDCPAIPMHLHPFSRLALLAAIVCSAPAHAAGVVGTGTSASCTEAALDAALAGGGVVTFNCGGPATIQITATKNVASTTTIDGSGQQVWFEGASAVRLFDVAASANFTLRQLGLQNGYHASQGGAIQALGPSALTLTDVTLRHNATDMASGQGGGAIYTDGGVATTLTRVALVENKGSTGGAIYAAGADDTLVLREVEVTDNRATNGGGAVRTVGKSLTVEAALFETNEVTGFGAAGGAVLVVPHTPGANALTVINSTFVGNKAGAGASGAAILLKNGPGGSITNSTLAGNGGDGAILVMDAVTQLVLKNTIVSGTVGGANCRTMYSATLADGGHNLQFGGDTPQSCGAAILEVDPLLPAFAADNGGFTRTLALPPGSPAIDAASGCPATDQRGYPRGAVCDIGAFESPLGAAGGGSGVAAVPALDGAGLALLSALLAGLGLRRRRRG